jgi:hypothetical protein
VGSNPTLSAILLRVVNGSGCVNPAAGKAGTGRFTGASGNLTMTATIMPVLRNVSNAPVMVKFEQRNFTTTTAPALLTNTGKSEGTIFGVAREDEEREDERQ